MPVPLNDLRRAYEARSEELSAAVTRVLDSGWYVHGPEHTAFEHEFAAYVGVRSALGVANGTDALELALRAVTDGRPGAVLTVANAGGYTTTAARRAGLAVRFADVDPATLCMDVDQVRNALARERLAAVVVTHLYGRLAEVETITSLCRAHGVPVVEDCAQAIGARRGGRLAGSFGEVAAFSFYPTKNLGALGDGGAVVTDDADVAARLGALRQYGWTSKYLMGTDGGRNSRLDELQAAVLRIRLRAVDEGNRRRRWIASQYRAAAQGGLTVLPTAGEDHVAHLVVATTDERERVQNVLRRAGIHTDIHYPVPDHRQPAIADEYAGISLPVTERSTAMVMSLPCFPELTDQEVAHVCRSLASL